MAQTFLQLVNQTCTRLNEVELTAGTFASAKGFYSHIKDAVNASIRHINQAHVEWPFNYDTAEEVLIVGQTRYSFPDDAKSIDFETFRLRKDTAINVDAGKYISLLPYDRYLQQYVIQEDDTTAAEGGIPEFVFRAKNLEWGIVPVPDKAYTINYEYYRSPNDLERYNDLTVIPDRYKHIIVDGATYYAYMFRDNQQAAQLIKEKFDNGIKFMRVHLINSNTTMASTMRV